MQLINVCSHVCGRVEKERKFLSRLIQRFFGILESIPKAGLSAPFLFFLTLDANNNNGMVWVLGHVKLEKVEYCTRFIELLVDLEVRCSDVMYFHIARKMLLV